MKEKQTKARYKNLSAGYWRFWGYKSLTRYTIGSVGPTALWERILSQFSVKPQLGLSTGRVTCACISPRDEFVRYVNVSGLSVQLQLRDSYNYNWDSYLVLVDPNAIILLTSRNYKLGMRPALRGARIAFKAGTKKNTIPAREKILREGVSLSSVDAVL